MDRSTVPQFTGSAYQGWAYNSNSALLKRSSTRWSLILGAGQEYPVVIEPLSPVSQAVLTQRQYFRDQREVDVELRNDEIDAWMTMDLEVCFMTKATREVQQPRDADYFSLFPMGDDAAPAQPPQISDQLALHQSYFHPLPPPSMWFSCRPTLNQGLVATMMMKGKCIG